MHELNLYQQVATVEVDPLLDGLVENLRKRAMTKNKYLVLNSDCF
jgi:hypothetical protein